MPRRIAVIPGDGVGPEVIEIGLRVLQAAAPADPSFKYETVSFPWGSEHYLRTGAMMDADALDQLARFDAIYFGAVGSVDVPDHITLWGLRLAIVQGFDQAISLRPARLLPGLRGPARGSRTGGCRHGRRPGEHRGRVLGRRRLGPRGSALEVGIETAVYTRAGIARVVRYAFEPLVAGRASGLTSATKSNASLRVACCGTRSSRRWAREFPDVAGGAPRGRAARADGDRARLAFDVVVASNLFGDVLSDLPALSAGGWGMAASGNLALERKVSRRCSSPSTARRSTSPARESRTPSGPVLARRDDARHSAADRVASVIRHAVGVVCARGILTPDVGGTASSANVAEAIIEAIGHPGPSPGEVGADDRRFHQRS